MKIMPYEKYYTKKQREFWEKVGTTESKKAYKEYLKLPFPEEEKEYRKVQKAIREKKGDWLGKWLEKFSIEGDFWSKEKKGKIKTGDWL